MDTGTSLNADGKTQRQKPVKRAATVKGTVDMISYDITLEDMSELIIQYGYVTHNLSSFLSTISSMDF